jgi:hypothetical protein
MLKIFPTIEFIFLCKTNVTLKEVFVNYIFGEATRENVVYIIYPSLLKPKNRFFHL